MKNNYILIGLFCNANKHFLIFIARNLAMFVGLNFSF